MSRKKKLLLLFLIIALGIFLRVYNINQTPPGVYPDEAVNGSDALNALKGEWQWFYPDNGGREGLFMNLVALCFKLFGVSVFSLKLPAIFFGTLTIIGTYLLGKELFRSERIGLISSFLVATSFWAMNFSRISFRANMLPAILVLSFYFLFRGLHKKKWSLFAIGGLIFGIGLHSYISFRIAPLILVLMLFILIFNRQNFLRRHWKFILIFIFFTLLSSAPMLYTFFVSHPEYWESRSSAVSIFSPAVNNGNPAAAFSKSLILSLIKYNFWGDQNWRHNFPPYPLLDPAIGIAFLFGLFYSIFKFFHLLSLRLHQKIHDEKLEAYFFLLASFFIMLVPEFLTAEGNPHALRAIGTLPFVFIFSALTLNYFLEYAEKHQPIFKKTVLVVFIAIILSSGIFNSLKYHIFWAQKPETAKAFEKNLMDIVAFLPTLPASQEKFVLAENMQRVPIRVFSQKISNLEFVYFGQAEFIEPKDKNNFIIVMTDRNDEVIGLLQKKFPFLTLEEKKDKSGVNFYILK